MAFNTLFLHVGLSKELKQCWSTQFISLYQTSLNNLPCAYTKDFHQAPFLSCPCHWHPTVLLVCVDSLVLLLPRSYLANCLRRANPTEVSMDLCLKTSKRRQPGLLGRSALCAREKELLSGARRTSVSRTSIYLVARKGAACHSFLESTNPIVENIAQHRTSTRGVLGKAASCVVKTYPEQVSRTSGAHVVVKLSTTESVSRNMPTRQQSTSSSAPSATTEKSFHRRC